MKDYPRYDERQMQVRYRIAFQTLMLTLGLILLNGLVSDFIGVWGTPLTQSMVLLCLPTLYFAGRTILAGAYLPRTDRRPVLGVIVFGAVGSAHLANWMSKEGNTLVEDGMLSPSTPLLVMALLFLILAVLLLFQTLRDRRAAREE